MFKIAKKKEKANPDNPGLRLLVRFISRYFGFLVLALVIIVLLVGYFNILQPKYKEITSEIERIVAAREQEKTSMERYLGRLVAYQRNYDLVRKSDRDKIYAVLPAQNPAEDLFTEMSYLIQGRGLLLNSITVTPDFEGGKNSKNSDVNGNIGIIKINMSIEGVDYKGFKNLLKTIENNLRLMDINSLSFSPGGKTVTMDITTYYLRS